MYKQSWFLVGGLTLANLVAQQVVALPKDTAPKDLGHRLLPVLPWWTADVPLGITLMLLASGRFQGVRWHDLARSCVWTYAWRLCTITCTLLPPPPGLECPWGQGGLLFSGHTATVALVARHTSTTWMWVVVLAQGVLSIAARQHYTSDVLCALAIACKA